MIKNKYKFSLLQATLWCTFSAVPIFLPAYLYSLGFTSVDVGIFLALQTAIGFVGQFFWSWCSDKKIGYKKSYILATALLIVGYILLFQVGTFGGLLVIAVITGFVQFSLPVILDTWILQVFSKNTAIYGPIRAVGSLSFAIFCFFYGSILSQWGFQIMPYFASVFGMISICVSLTLKEKPISQTDTIRNTQGLQRLLTNTPYCYLLALVFFVGLSATPFMQIISVKIESIGASVSQLGIAMFMSSICQLPPMFYYQKLAKISVKRLIILSLLVTSISYLLYANTHTFYALLCSMGLNGLGFGILLPTIRRAVFTLTDTESAASAQGLIDAMQLCVAGIIGNLLTGRILDDFGLALTVNLYLITSACAIFTVLLLYRKK